MNFDITDAAPEHKAGFSTGARDDYDELRHTFQEFKAANDERLAVIEHKRGDVLLEEKVDRINQALDAQQRRSQAGPRRRERRCGVSPEI
jgi:predicted phage gp36 major capsid-like protein